MRTLSPLLFTSVSLLAFAPPSGFAAPAKPPNIIFILTDDLGWGDIGVLFQNGRKARNERSEPWHLTPHIDRMAEQGATLPHHYCPAPVCAPSRASLLLGVHQGHANVRDNQFDKALEANHTLASVMKARGYATVAIGKWGLQGEKDGATSDWPAHPLNRGFDQYFGYIAHKDGHEHYPKESVHHAGKPVPLLENRGSITDSLDKCYTTDLFTARAKKWILDHQTAGKAQPFFMYLAFDTPHAVLELPTQAYPAGGGLKGGIQWLATPGHMINTASGEVDSWIHPEYAQATYDHDRDTSTPEVPWPDVYKRHATSVRRIDDGLGDLFHLLKDLNLDEDTFVVFTSDNGPAAESYLKEPYHPDFFKSFGRFDGMKRDCWEGGVRVPAFVRWPGHIPPGRVVDSPSAFWDWMPTFASLADVAPPARTDGVSLLPALTGSGKVPAPSAIYIEYAVKGKTPAYEAFAPQHRQRTRQQMQLVRQGDLVGVRYDVRAASDPFEIYDVRKDPQELHNLAGDAAMAAVQQRMKDRVLQLRRPDGSAPRPYDAEFVPAVSDVATVPGVIWKFYAGTFPWVPDTASLEASSQGQGSLPDYGQVTKEQAGAVDFTGFLRIQTAGEYSFALQSDSGAVLRIHEATLIDADYGYASGSQRKGAIRLAAGLHPFHLTCRKNLSSAAVLKWSVSGPDLAEQPVPATLFERAK
jgi:arylsulfatase A-like enzyme